MLPLGSTPLKADEKVAEVLASPGTLIVNSHSAAAPELRATPTDITWA